MFFPTKPPDIFCGVIEQAQEQQAIKLLSLNPAKVPEQVPLFIIPSTVRLKISESFKTPKSPAYSKCLSETTKLYMLKPSPSNLPKNG